MAGGSFIKWMLAGAALPAFVAGLLVAVLWLRDAPPDEAPPAFAVGTGRIEAVEYGVATRRPGRVEKILVAEGQMVEAGQPVAQMDVTSLQADLSQAEADLAQARDDLQKAWAAVPQRESEISQALTAIDQREAELSAAAKNLNRLQSLYNKDLIARKDVDEQRAAKQTIEALLAVERARKQTAEAALRATQIQVDRQNLAIQTAAARIQRLQKEIAESVVNSPRRGRVSSHYSKAGEWVTAGRKLLGLLEPGEISMTVSLPVDKENRIALGSEARVVFDGSPNRMVPAVVSFVAASQSPDKKDEPGETDVTHVALAIDADSIIGLQPLKPGLQGTVYVRLDPNAAWPEHLKSKLPD